MAKYTIVHTVGVGAVKCQLEFVGDDEDAIERADLEAAEIYTRIEASHIRAAIRLAVEDIKLMLNEQGLSGSVKFTFKNLEESKDGG